MINQVENALIAAIDSRTVTANYPPQLFGFRKLTVAVFAQSWMEAQAFPGLTDVELSKKVASMEIMVAGAELEMDQFLANTDLSIYKLKQLPKKDLTRKKFLKMTRKVANLKSARERLLQCLNSRLFLKTRLDWTCIYLEITERLYGEDIRPDTNIEPYKINEIRIKAETKIHAFEKMFQAC